MRVGRRTHAHYVNYACSGRRIPLRDSGIITNAPAHHFKILRAANPSPLSRQRLTLICQNVLSMDYISPKSFVKKVKSRVSEFIPSSLTRWFGGSNGGTRVRQREEVDDDEEDESYQLQPPPKRQRVPERPPLPQQHQPALTKADLNFVSTPINPQHKLGNFSIGTSCFEPSPGPSNAARNAKKLNLPNSVRNFNGTLKSTDVNCDKDSDSGESTSGYSSMPRIGSKEHVSEAEKNGAAARKANNRSLFNTSVTNERSLFTERSISSPQNNTSLSSRRPAFNASSFGTPTFMDRTVSTKRIINSPFYAGRTVFGGASAYGRELFKQTSPESASSLKNFVQPKPANETATNKNATLSKTAQRILDTLQQYTSPSQDVKRVPNPRRQQRAQQDGLISKFVGVNPYVIRDSKVSSNRELQVPTTSDLLKMKLKERLQDSTVSVREMATKSNSPLNQEEYKLRTDEPSTAPQKKNTNKMKTKVAAVRQRVEAVETVEEVKLPDVQLPISTLPTFDFNIPLAAPKPTAAAVTTTTTTNSPATSTPVRPPKTKKKTTLPESKARSSIKVLSDIKIAPEFVFSKPLVIAENLKSITAINNFKFSDPVCQKSGTTAGVTFKSDTPPKPARKKTPTKNNGENKTVPGPATELLSSGSVMDVLGKDTSSLADKFKPAKDSWECKICMIRNTPDKSKCIACEAPKLDNETKTPPSSKSFGDKFKMASNQWECGACLVRNESNRNSCVACETPKDKSSASPPAPKGFSFFKMPADKWECSTCLVRNDSGRTSCMACETPKASTSAVKPPVSSAPAPRGFGSQFTMASDKWECSVCMVRNDGDKATCVACTNPKPATSGPSKPAVNGPTLPTFGDKFKAPASSWECDMCMVRNDADKLKCVACESPRLGTKQTVAKQSTGFGENYKKKDSEWECPSCMVRNSGDKTKCACCDGFKPGTVKPMKVEENKSLPKFSFGIPMSQVNGSGFKFGIAPAASDKADKDAATVAPAIVFGEAAKIDTPPAKPPTFSFGVPAQANNGAKPDTKSTFGTKRVASEDGVDAVESKKEPVAKASTASKELGVNGNATVAKIAKTESSTAVTTSAPVLFTEFGGSNKMTVPMFGGQSKTQTANETTKPESKPALLFNTAKSEIATLPAASLGTAQVTASITSTMSTFKFTPASNGGFSFGSKTENNASASSPLTFGSPTTKPALTTGAPVTTISNTIPSFSLNATQSFGISSPSFAIPSTTTTGFGAAAKSSPGGFGTKPNTEKLFGYDPPPFVATQPIPTQNTLLPTFGSPAANQVKPTFGGANTFGAFGTTTNSPSAFGATPSTGGTAFGFTSPPKSGGFGGFGTTSTAFGSSSTPSNVFGGAATATVAATPAVPQPQPVQNGMFSFGASSASVPGTPKASFSFGSSAAAAPSGGFSFGGASGTQNPSGAFNFGGAVDAKPTFNFSTGSAPSTFTAQQQQTGDTKRVYKRALRRTQR